MAGAGYKQWATGAVLTSSDMNTYVGDQVVMVFASSSARSSGVSSPTEGMVSYLKDTNAIEYYDGSSWGGIGDITAVTAGTNIDVTSGTGPVPSVALAIDAAVSMGSDGSGVDVTFYSSTAGDTMLWDASEEKLVITGTNGQNSLEVADGDVSITDSLTVSGGLVAPLQINAQTGTTYTFVIGDAGKLVTSSNGSAQTITIPPNSSVAFAIGTQIMVQNLGSANATLAQGSGVTIQSKDSNKEIDGQYAAATCIKTATDTWSLIGALK
jgi:hypothetical protein